MVGIFLSCRILTEFDSDIGVELRNTTLSTNGTLMTQNYAKKLKDMGVSVVQVSVDGLEEMHDFIRGKGSFLKAVCAIEMLQKVEIVTRLAFTANCINYVQLKDVFLLSQKIGTDWFIAFRYMESGREGLKISLEKNQLRIVTENLIELQKKFPRKVFFEKLLFFPFLLDDGLQSGKTCNAGKSIMNICANGDVTSCPHVRDNIVGNVLERSFDEIWSDPLIEMDGIISDDCKTCNHVECCMGGCKGTFSDGMLKDALCWKKS